MSTETLETEATVNQSQLLRLQSTEGLYEFEIRAKFLNAVDAC